jgi:hypothetical protein
VIVKTVHHGIALPSPKLRFLHLSFAARSCRVLLAPAYNSAADCTRSAIGWFGAHSFSSWGKLRKFTIAPVGVPGHGVLI